MASSNIQHEDVFKDLMAPETKQLISTFCKKNNHTMLVRSMRRMKSSINILKSTLILIPSLYY